jgi:hypothetical protein
MKDLIEQYPTVKNSFFAWVGQNGTYGQPHPVTGNYSRYGKYFAFASKAERDAFVDGYHDFNGNNYAVRCTVRTGRQYSLGMAVWQYVETLAYAERP